MQIPNAKWFCGWGSWFFPAGGGEGVDVEEEGVGLEEECVEESVEEGVGVEEESVEEEGVGVGLEEECVGGGVVRTPITVN